MSSFLPTLRIVKGDSWSSSSAAPATMGYEQCRRMVDLQEILSRSCQPWGTTSTGKAPVHVQCAGVHFDGTIPYPISRVSHYSQTLHPPTLHTTISTFASATGMPESSKLLWKEHSRLAPARALRRPQVECFQYSETTARHNFSTSLTNIVVTSALYRPPRSNNMPLA